MIWFTRKEIERQLEEMKFDNSQEAVARKERFKGALRQDDFRKEYLNEWSPHTLLSWLEDFCDQLDCDEPEMPIMSEANKVEYFKRVGAYETQMGILEKLRYAIKYENLRNTKEE